MTSWTIPAALVGVVALAAPARADQCEWVSSNVARTAMEELARHDHFIEFCEPCGDKVPGAPQKIESLTKKSVGGSWEVRINGRAVDLAYTYAPTDPVEYQNVGLRSGCGATGVSAALRVEGAAPNGVLIYPSQRAIESKVQPEPTPEPTPAPAPAPAAPAPAAPVVPTIIMMSSTTTSTPSWWPVVAGAGGASAIWLVWAMAAARRRRGAMAPRAAHLVDRGSKR